MLRYAESVYSDGNESEHDKGGDDGADNLESLHPRLIAPAEGLEHAPEAVREVEPDGDEPHDVESEDVPLAEYGGQEDIRVILISSHAEHLRQLHLSPEMAEMESDEAENDNAENRHILGRPGIRSGLACDLIALVASASLVVLKRQPDAIGDVDDETERKNRNHNGYHGSGHEVAAYLEQTVAGREKDVIVGAHTEFASAGIHYREKVNGSVEQEEDHKESTADALDEFPADGGVKNKHI